MKKNASKIVLAVSLVAAVMGLSSCGKKEEENVLYLYNWTYYTPDSVIAQFEQQFNRRITQFVLNMADGALLNS